MSAPLHPEALRLTIQNTLKPITLWTPDVEELLMATSANESHLGQYRIQIGSGIAKGIFQMETEDHNDIWDNYLQYHQDLVNKAKSFNDGERGTADDLVNNDPYSIFMCRIHYLRRAGSIPAGTDIEAIWYYYKQYYNTPKGGATHDAFMQNYDRYVRGQQT